MEHPLNPPPAQRALSLLSNSTHLCQKSAEVRPHQQEHVAHMRQSLGTLLFAMLSLFISRYRVLSVFFHSKWLSLPKTTMTWDSLFPDSICFPGFVPKIRTLYASFLVPTKSIRDYQLCDVRSRDDIMEYNELLEVYIPKRTRDEERVVIMDRSYLFFVFRHFNDCRRNIDLVVDIA